MVNQYTSKWRLKYKKPPIKKNKDIDGDFWIMPCSECKYFGNCKYYQECSDDIKVNRGLKHFEERLK